jgi:hypothetical protein
MSKHSANKVPLNILITPWWFTVIAAIALVVFFIH